MKKLVCLCLMVCAIGFAGCTSFGVWSPTAQTDIAKAVAFYNTWVAGAVKAAPSVLAQVAAIAGKDNPKVVAATSALAGLTTTLDKLNTAAQAGTGTNTAEANMSAAIASFNTAFGAAKATLATVQ